MASAGEGNFWNTVGSEHNWTSEDRTNLFTGIIKELEFLLDILYCRNWGLSGQITVVLRFRISLIPRFHALDLDGFATSKSIRECCRSFLASELFFVTLC